MRRRVAIFQQDNARKSQRKSSQSGTALDGEVNVGEVLAVLRRPAAMEEDMPPLTWDEPEARLNFQRAL